MASDENETSFEAVLKNQIKILRKQLDKAPTDLFSITSNSSAPHPPLPPKPDMAEVARAAVEESVRSAGACSGLRLVSF